MISESDLYHQLGHVLEKTELPFLGDKYEGKVRDNYVKGDTRFLITSDRLSCFDVVVTSIPFKGQVLNDLAIHWFKLSEDVVQNHIIDIPDPNVMVVKNCELLPVEIIVRSYITGSAWRDYEAGKTISGITLPPGLKPSQKLPEFVITPSTKAARGAHDAPISEEEILSRGLVSKKLWDEVKSVALSLFKLGEIEASRGGLLLVDTKYEFGLYKGKLVLCDEIHTLDSSRYWVGASYEKRFLAGEPPEMLDKEPTRQWLLSRGFMGNGEIPEFTDAHRMQIAQHYISSFAKITGREFSAEVGSVHARIEKNLKEWIRKNG